MSKTAWSAAALCGLTVGLGLAIPAHGSGDAIGDYIIDHGREVCSYIDDQPSLTGVKHAVDHILETSGLPEDQTGKLLAGSVVADCPQDGLMVEEFVWYVRRHQSQQSQPGAIAFGP